MCGIFGHWNRDGAPVDIDRLRAATASLRHRGPDDEGYLLADTRSGRAVLCGGDDTTPALNLPRLDAFAGQQFDLAFGFRRLSILDLSPAGHQPMAGAGGRHWIVFNGEIYNFVELRRELEAGGRTFRSGSDTEVILAAYEAWGEGCVERLRGMFGFALWDGERRRMLLARDRFGIKPLYVARDGAAVAFASEAKALIVNGTEFRPNAAAVASYVAFGALGRSFFDTIDSVPAAHLASVTADAFAPRRYWSLPDPDPQPLPLTRVREEYGALLNDAIRIHLRADVPVGTCLSGGLDSSSIVAMTERLGAHQETFSAVYEDDGVWNERQYIEQVVAATGATPHFVVPSRERMMSELEALVWHQDEPFTTTSMFAQWCVMRLARDTGVRVLLDGQGADETLAGYHSFYAEHFRGLRLVARLREASAAGKMNLAVKEIVRPFVSGAVARRRERTISAQAAASPLRGSAQLPASPDPRNLHEALVAAVTRDPLPHLLRYEDRNAMAWSIEGRVPFLDHVLVEFVFRHGDGVRIRNGWTKWLQRVTVEPLLPATIVWRRDKVGFATPERQWLAGVGELAADTVRDVPAACDILDPARVRAADAAVAWRCLVLGIWLRRFGAAARRNESSGGSIPSAAKVSMQ